MPKKYNKNLQFLISEYRKGTKGVILEGSSRSGKTWSGIDFIIYLCSKHEKKITINVIKETYNSFKTTLYDDFSKRLNDYGLDNPFERSKEIATFKIFNHRINFLGADMPSKFHGASADFTWFNEALDVDRAIFDQAEMRTRVMFWGDYNPSASIHYIYDSVIPRDDVAFLKTTFLDNPHLSVQERKKILSYEPTEDNKRQGTADEYMWSVYGLGIKMARTGLVYKNVTWIDSFPDNIEEIGYGLDFGFTTHPSALVKVGVNGNDMFVQLLIYEPTENADYLYQLIKASIPNYEDVSIFADSASPAMIGDLNRLGLNIQAVHKFNGSIMYGIGLNNSYNVHFVKHKALKKEQENYAYRVINGKPLDEPIKDFDHAMDAWRYISISRFRKNF